MKSLKGIIILQIIVFLASFSLHAQNRNTVNGVVMDAETGEKLPGAGIKIRNSVKGTTTDLDGGFILTNIHDDQVVLDVSYIGYESASIDCDFSTNPTLDITIRLNPVSTKLDQVEVKSSAEGQVKAMLDQKNAVNIKNVVSSEQIEQFPDMNAAEVIQRIPGITLQRDQGEGRYVQLRGTPPELTNFSINGEQIPSPEGDVRYVGLDIVSADQIEVIEVTKVLTPDMDGDGIGGTVNIITKTAKSEIPEIKASVAGGYNHLRKTDNYQLQFAYGQRLNKFGFNLNSSYYLNNQGSDNMEFKYAKAPFWGSTQEGEENYHVQYREFQLRHYDITRQRIGLSATFDYQFSDRSMIYLRGMYNSFSDDERRRRLLYDLDDAISEEYYLYGGIDRDVRDRIKKQELSSVNMGGKHNLGFLAIDYEAAYSLASEIQPNRIEAVFDNTGQAITMKWDRSDPDWPRVYFPEPRDSVNATSYDTYEFEELLFEDREIIDQNITTKINFEIPFTLALNKGYFKFGGKYRNKEKERDVNAREYGGYFTDSRTYPGEGPEISLLTFTDDFTETNLLNHGYAVDYIPDPAKMRNFFEFYQQFFILDRTETKNKTYGTDYKAREDIYALFGMFRYDINNLMILGGLRYEKTVINYEGRRVVVDWRNNFQELDTLTDKNRIHEFLLPNFQLRYKIRDNSNIRLSYTQTFARPNFEDVLPYRSVDGKEVNYGNAELNYPISSNADLLIERYISEGGIFSGGIFYKQIKDFVFYFKRFAREGEHTGSFSPREITKAINGNKAEVYGAEVQTQFKFYFLPGFLSNFGFFGNYTFTYSEAFINKRFPANITDAVVIFGEDSLGTFSSIWEEEEITLPGQAKHTTNLAIFFDSKRLYSKITANYHDAFLHTLGADPDLDEYYASAWHLDFTAHYSITEHLKLFTDIVNLTNAPLKFYLGTPDRLLQQEYYSFWGRIGIKLDF